MQNENPYAAPSTRVEDISELSHTGALVAGGRPVPTGHGWQWIVDGFDLFKRSPGNWIVIVILLGVIFVVLGVIPLIGALGSVLLFPVFVGGLMLGCHALHNAERLEVGDLFAGFRDKLVPLLQVGGLYLLGSFVVSLVAILMFGFGMFAGVMAGRVGAGLLLGALVIAAAMIPLVMAVWFAPALVVLHGLPPVEAMKQSFSGCLKNIVPFIVYGFVSLIIGFIAAIPLMLGWLLWGPTLAASVYTSYRDIFVDAA